MSRKQQTSGPRIARASTSFGDNPQNKKIVTISIAKFDWPEDADPKADRGNIVATARPPSGSVLRYSKLLERRSTRRVSVVLAGLIACVAATPSSANSGRAASPAKQEAPSSQGDASRGWSSESGTASWYGQRHHGRRTASGTRFDQHAMTAAHPWLPMGAKVRVTRRDTGQSIVVTITDRLPSRKHIIDLSFGAAQRLGVIRSGTADVDLEPA